MSKKAPMKLWDKYTGMMECQVCGSIHAASVKPNSNGAFYRGSLQCIYGCEMPTKAERQAYNGAAGAMVDLLPQD